MKKIKQLLSGSFILAISFLSTFFISRVNGEDTIIDDMIMGDIAPVPQIDPLKVILGILIVVVLPISLLIFLLVRVLKKGNRKKKKITTN